MTTLDPDRVFGSAFDNAPIGMAVLDMGGVIRMCNPAVGELLGRAPGELLGDTFFSVTHPDDLPAAKDNCTRIAQGEVRIVRHECRFLRPDGSSFWVSVSTSRVAAEDGHPAHCVMHIEDVDDRKSLEAELRHRALHDPLTGLGNRRLLLDRIRAASDRPCCVFYLDLNGFKSVNDRFGHGTGDRVLCMLADRLSGVLDDGDTAVRLGGDEFVILRPDGVPEESPAFVEELGTLIARPIRVDEHDVNLTVAVGVTRTLPDEKCSPEAVLDRADRRMYETKAGVRAP